MTAWRGGDGPTGRAWPLPTTSTLDVVEVPSGTPYRTVDHDLGSGLREVESGASAASLVAEIAVCHLLAGDTLTGT